MGVVWRTQSTHFSGPALSSMVAISNVWPCKFKLIKWKIQVLNCTDHILCAQQLHVLSGHHIGQHIYKTFLPPQKLLLDDALLDPQIPYYSQTIRRSPTYLHHLICTATISYSLLWKCSWPVLRAIERNSPTAISHPYAPTNCSLLWRLGVGLLLVSSVIDIANLVTDHVSDFTLATKSSEPELRTNKNFIISILWSYLRSNSIFTILPLFFLCPIFPIIALFYLANCNYLCKPI